MTHVNLTCGDHVCADLDDGAVRLRRYRGPVLLDARASLDPWRVANALLVDTDTLRDLAVVEALAHRCLAGVER